MLAACHYSSNLTRPLLNSSVTLDLLDQSQRLTYCFLSCSTIIIRIAHYKCFTFSLNHQYLTVIVAIRITLVMNNQATYGNQFSVVFLYLRHVVILIIMAPVCNTALQKSSMTQTSSNWSPTLSSDWLKAGSVWRVAVVSIMILNLIPGSS